MVAVFWLAPVAIGNKKLLEDRSSFEFSRNVEDPVFSRCRFGVRTKNNSQNRKHLEGFGIGDFSQEFLNNMWVLRVVGCGYLHIHMGSMGIVTLTYM